MLYYYVLWFYVCTVIAPAPSICLTFSFHCVGYLLESVFDNITLFKRCVYVRNEGTKIHRKAFTPFICVIKISNRLNARIWLEFLIFNNKFTIRNKDTKYEKRFSMYIIVLLWYERKKQRTQCKLYYFIPYMEMYTFSFKVEMLKFNRKVTS